MSGPDEVVIREVGPRDGLQGEAPVDVGDRVRLIEALVEAGARRIEAAAFVSPKAVPSMAGAAEVLAAVPRNRGVRWAALVPNLRGAAMARDAGVDEITVTVSISATYNLRNVRMSPEESVAVIGEICAAAGDVPVDAVVSCAFGSPYEGDVAPADAASMGEHVRAVGAAAVTYADTTGMATPRRVADLLDVVGVDVGLHLHETRGTGLVNAYAAWQAGVHRFDASVAGLGGSPFAEGAAGNVSTESLVALFDDLDVGTGIDLEALLRAAAVAQDIVGHDVASPLLAAGPRDRLVGEGA